MSAAPSRAAESVRNRQRCRLLSTGWQQPVENPGIQGGLVPSGPLVSAAPVAPNAVASSAMEGTSGIANPTLLRGSGGCAALGPGGVRASDVFAPCGSAYAAPGLPGARRTRERAAGEPARAGRRGSASSYPSRGWGSCGGIVTGVFPSRALPSRALPQRERRSATPGLQPAAQRSHDERCPSGSGWDNPSLQGTCKGARDRGRNRRRKPKVPPDP